MLHNAVEFWNIYRLKLRIQSSDVAMFDDDFIQGFEEIKTVYLFDNLGQWYWEGTSIKSDWQGLISGNEEQGGKEKV